MLSGHMHGGQVTLFGLFAPMTPSRTGGKYVSGRYQKGDTTLIVSNGIGVFRAACAVLRSAADRDCYAGAGVNARIHFLSVPKRPGSPRKKALKDHLTAC